MQKLFKKYILSLAVLGAMVLMQGCSGAGEWTVDGTIEGADGEMMLLEASDNGRWVAVDSVKLDASGRFKMSQKAAAYPDIYRLRLGNKTLYFPIDSIETVTVISRASAFDTEYTLGGSATAERLMDVDRKLMDAVNRDGAQAAALDSTLKRELGGIVLSDQAGIISYYIINKRVGGLPLFDPANRRDLRIIGAVANAYSQLRPDDPRTEYLKRLYLTHRANTGIALSDTIEAEVVSIFDMDLYDATGQKRALKALTDEGKVVLLNFTVYSAAASPEFNRQLYAIYDKYRDRGLEIYQVAVDEDENQWRQAAKNLPWIAVYNSPVTGARNLMNYNVTELPVSFIIDRNGEIVERIEDHEQLDRMIYKHLN